MEFVEQHRAKLEAAVCFATADRMSADVDLVFYDTTSLHLEANDEDDAERHRYGHQYPAQLPRGHAKDGRTDALQIVVGLAITRDGLPVRCWVFPGNTADVSTVARVRNDLGGWRLGRCVFVGDAGTSSEDSRRQLALGGGKCILAARTRAGAEVTTDVLSRPRPLRDGERKTPREGGDRGRW